MFKLDVDRRSHFSIHVLILFKYDCDCNCDCVQESLKGVLREISTHLEYVYSQAIINSKSKKKYYEKINKTKFYNL